MRISDWSSDVCSSDLADEHGGVILGKSLKIAVHPPLARRDRKRIIGTREMVEADRNIAGVGQASIAEFGLLEAQPLVRQPARVDTPLARDHLQQVGIAEKGDRKCTRLNSSNQCASRMPAYA